MKISIITPVYNGERFIKETIESVLNQQGEYQLEYIIIDGASTDGSISIIQQYEQKYRAGEYRNNCLDLKFISISEQDNGMYDAIKKGFALCTGDIIGWINADDYYVDGVFGKINALFMELPQVSWIAGRCNVLDESRHFVCRSQLRYYPNEFILKGVFGRFSNFFIPQESTFWRRELLELVNLDEFAQYQLAGDFYLWYQFAKKVTLYSVDEDFAVFRSTENNLSSDKDKYRTEMREIMNYIVDFSDRDRVLLRSYAKVWKNTKEREDKFFPYICRIDGRWEIVKKRGERHNKIVSIVTVCRNEENVLYTCESIINQTWNDYEWIVVDGASTDGTLDILKKYEDNIDVFISEPDEGIYNAMNKGIINASGEWIIFLNGGDQFYDFYVLEHVFKNNRYTEEILYGNEERYNSYGQTHIYTLPSVIPPYFMCYQAFAHQAMFYRRELFHKYGLYDESYKISGDSEKNTLFLLQGVSFRKINCIVSSYVLDGLSNDKNYCKLLDEERKRRRLKYYSKNIVELYQYGVTKSSVDLKIPIIKIKSFKQGRIKKYYLFGILLLFTAKRFY